MTSSGSTQRGARAWATPVVLSLCFLWFITAACALIPFVGIENDEALFSTAIYAPAIVADCIRVFDHPVAIMVMSYVGALKAWVYALIWSACDTSVWSLRLPVVALGIVSIFFCFWYLKYIAGRTAAVIGAILLATDVTFLLTTTFDWGPVVFQQALLFSGLVLILRFYRTRSNWCLGAGFLLFGLALWDKALFLWMFSGIGVAAALLFWKEIQRLLSRRRVLIAIGSMLFGALPFVGYNLTNGFATFRDKRYTLEDWRQNVALLSSTLDGTAMAGFLIDYGSPAPPPTNLNGLEAASVGIAEAAGHPGGSLLPYLLLLALLLAPFSWKTPARRALLFFAIAFSIAWFQMLITAEAGGSAHHTILLWPHVIGFIAVSLAGAAHLLRGRARWAIGAAVAVVALSNMLTVNEHLAGLIRYGPGPMWSDACFPLVKTLREENPQTVFAADWGMGDTMRMYLRHQIPVRNGIEPFYRQKLDAFSGVTCCGASAPPAASS